MGLSKEQIPQTLWKWHIRVLSLQGLAWTDSLAPGGYPCLHLSSLTVHLERNNRKHLVNANQITPFACTGLTSGFPSVRSKSWERPWATVTWPLVAFLTQSPLLPLLPLAAPCPHRSAVPRTHRHTRTPGPVLEAAVVQSFA